MTLIHSKRTIRYFLLGLLLLLAAGCNNGGGGDSGDSSGIPPTDNSTDTPPVSGASLSGQVADGYLIKAQVFLDRNANRVHDNGEPMSYTADNGSYVLAVEAGEGDLYPVVARAEAGVTIDADDGLYIEESYVLESPPGHWEFVSPLTTLVKLELDKNPLISLSQAVLRVRSQVGIADEVSLFENYLISAPGNAILAEELGRTHRAARAIAGLMGQLRSLVVANLGRELSATEEEAVAYLLSDRILSRSAIIEAALNHERNYGDDLDVEGLVSSILAIVENEPMDGEVLADYAERIDQGLDSWDMTPPQILSSSPTQSSVASIATTITVAFDEGLDEAVIEHGGLALTGPNGVVAGSLVYDAAGKKLSFTPDQYLLPHTDYQVVLKADLADAVGNRLGEEKSWSFSTIFDQTPPALPEFF